MPTPPYGCRWFARPVGEGWLALYLGPVGWSDEQIQRPNFHALGVWPNSLLGMCGSTTQNVTSMARQLIESFHVRFEAESQSAAMAELINGGPS